VPHKSASPASYLGAPPRPELYGLPTRPAGLGKHHKLYIDRVEHECGGASLADRLAAALARVRGETPQEVRRSSRRTERHRRSQVGTRTGRHQTLPERCRKLSVQRQGSRDRVSAD
jgi:hypothetical protein